ncbi:unnamed protein product, partial [Phaeothamnion confervicola]
ADGSELDPPLLYDVVAAADEFLMPALKSQCVGAAIRTADAANAFEMLSVARLYGLGRLESHVMIVFAQVSQMGTRLCPQNLPTICFLPSTLHSPAYITPVYSQHLDELIESPEFEALVQESADSINFRETADSIPFVDDIAFHVS